MRGIVLILVLSVVCADRYHPERLATSAGRVNPGEEKAQFWYNEAEAGIRARVARGASIEGQKAKNIIMFLGDGMSVPTLAAARTLLGQRNLATGEEAQLSFEEFPTLGLSKTYCTNQQIPDSACTATAYLCGVKANYGTIGVTAEVRRSDCAAYMDPATHVESIAEWALEDGRDVGIVTTTRITHASPAGTYAKTANRTWENNLFVEQLGYNTNDCPDIAHQLVHMNPGKQFKVILGGGRREFLSDTMRDEENARGRRTDGRNLIEEWQEDKRNRNVSYAYVGNRGQLLEAAENMPEYLLGLFKRTHLEYNMQRDPEIDPTLEELTEVAIKSLSRSEKGFFLFVEGGRIDHAHHDNYVHLALDETIEFSKAVKKATELLPEEDTLIVVTSDHAHVMAFNGYSPRGHDILGPSNDRGSDGVPYMTLSYTNGPGGEVANRQHVNGIRPDVTQETNFNNDLEWRSHVDVPLDSETHGGDDVAVFARGPQHTMFSGLYEQSQIPHLMAYAACIGPGLHACRYESTPTTESSQITESPQTTDSIQEPESTESTESTQLTDPSESSEDNSAHINQVTLLVFLPTLISLILHFRL